MIADHTGGSSRAGSLPLVASELAFDFTNTASGRGGPNELEHLREGRDVVIWARHAKAISDSDRDAALAALAADAGLATRLLAEALDLRDTIYRIGLSLSRRQQPDEQDRSQLAAIHAHCLACAKLSPFGDGFVWRWDAGQTLSEAIRGPIALSALTVLTQQNLARIKQCEGDHCGWLFFDTTKNRLRRWCEMSVCGNRAKVRAFRQRHFEAKATG
ncbi:CGNR zinc finger domain-containing protein [Bosea vestrisii]|uniref:CGNR zinc finger domain-containing protein n=1 Tax=Bosea vestrisii TaxID=151416 RepID=UPI0024DF933D|nr:CGNR zinc finger domain-containing protein [Bosea vestrisii]WID95977.1 CGNR zinc finger domain-containing protein [Bosea vestrisii]